LQASQGFVPELSSFRRFNQYVTWRAGRATAIVIAGVFMVGVAHAVGESVAPSGGKLAGIFAGMVLAAIFGYAFFLYVQPLIRARDRAFWWAALLMLGLWLLKMVTAGFCKGFETDVSTYEAWALKIAADGPASMYSAGYFLDYPPAYLYALWVAGWFAQAFHASGAALRIIVETPAMTADFLLSLLMFATARRNGKTLMAWAAMLMVALNPALLFDTVGWGQTDSALTLVMMLDVLMLLEEEYELAWGLAALAILLKPQALTLIPVIGLWTILKLDPRRWWRSAVAFVTVAVVGVAPFQTAQPWNWLPNLYRSTAAYYHETSVNAFNFMALAGGLRQNDGGAVLGISYFAMGMVLLLPLYGLAGLVLWRNPVRRNLFFAAFIALFGFFMFAPRMHERYLYSAVVFAIPLAIKEPAMLAVFGLVTLTCLFNLAYVLHTLRTTVFLDPRDLPAMAASMLNLLAFAIAAAYGYARAGVMKKGEVMDEAITTVKRSAPGPAPEDQMEGWLAATLTAVRAHQRLGVQWAETLAPLPWARIDAALMVILLSAAAAVRFWHLGHPPEIVFDEVHFVGQARHYLRAEPFLDPHPPIAKLLIALSIELFGDHSWSWRMGNALMGTVLAGVTYLLGRRMFRSRLAATLSAGFVAFDGFFIVDSRIGCIDIVYLTFAAIAYLLLFRFMDTIGRAERRRTLVYIAIALGLCLGSKLYVPGVTFLLVTGFVIFTMMRAPAYNPLEPDSARIWRTAGAVILVGSVSAFFYLGSFLPHYLLGWWGGISDLFQYYANVRWYENSVSTATHPYASPWWSWPLMLRPVAYWQNFPQEGNVSSIWGAGNPLTWWAVIPAMTIMAIRATERPNTACVFLVIAFLAYYVIWIPIHRLLFLYHYMPSVYIGYLALGAVLADSWNGESEWWESFAIFLTMFPALTIGIGHLATIFKPSFILENFRTYAGLPAVAILGLVYIVLLKRGRTAQRFVCVAFLATAVAVFIYFIPVWLGIPISRSGYYARMWLEGPGLRNWI
jgi:dolichyl-phosphate-mannose--protein O-mannosyl transferase/Gpi18-like mannosyltransferase